MLSFQTFFKKIHAKLNHHPTMKNWLWFIGLWLFGLFAILSLSYGTKALLLLLK